MRPLLLLLLATGCVPKARFELVQLQLDATRTALATRDAQSRDTLATTQQRANSLDEQLVERNLLVESMQERIANLEKQVDTHAGSQAAALMEGIEACPPLPEIPPCPTCDGTEPITPELPEEPPEVTEKRKLVQATLEEITSALAQSARTQASDAERETQNERVKAAFQGLVDEGYAEVLRVGDGTVVRVLVAKLYNENRTSISPLGEELIKKLAKGLAELPGHELSIVGHTDDQPVSSIEHPSNWELGFAYATGVRRGLEYEGIPMKPQMASRAGTRPVRDEDSAEARRLNRRVELWLTPDPAVLHRELADQGEPPEERPPDGQDEDKPLPPPPSDG